MTYRDTLRFLYHRETARIDLKLDRVQAALQRCGNPERRFPSIHVGGTNGKGSTAAFLHAILSAAGYRVGLFTSPHLVSFCERIRVGPDCVAESLVVDAVSDIRARIEPAGLTLTPFEMMTVLAFWIFARSAVDIAVVEVGMGGRLDATNVLSPLITVITTVGLDHQQYLGARRVEIAGEKGGIIKSDVPVVIGLMDSECGSVLEALAAQSGSRPYRYGRDFSVCSRGDGRFDYRGVTWCVSALRNGLRGRFQQHNAGLAVAALELLADSLGVRPDHVRRGVACTAWPGRLEVVSQNPLVVLDGAHNPASAATLAAELRAMTHGRPTRLLFGAMRDKDWRTMVTELAPVTTQVAVTAIRQPRAEDPAVLRSVWSAHRPVRVYPDAESACRHLISELGAGESLVVCGSLFLVGEVYPIFGSSTRPLCAPPAVNGTRRA